MGSEGVRRESSTAGAVFQAGGVKASAEIGGREHQPAEVEAARGVGAAAAEPGERDEASVAVRHDEQRLAPGLRVHRGRRRPRARRCTRRTRPRRRASRRSARAPACRRRAPRGARRASRRERCGSGRGGRRSRAPGRCAPAPRRGRRARTTGVCRPAPRGDLPGGGSSGSGPRRGAQARMMPGRSDSGPPEVTSRACGESASWPRGFRDQRSATGEVSAFSFRSTTAVRPRACGSSVVRIASSARR